MMGEHSHIRFAFFFLVFISFARSEINVNHQLELDFSCSTSSDQCDSKKAFCNPAGKCQCLFGYLPNGSKCEVYPCSRSLIQTCSLLYNDSYATCDHDVNHCRCFAGFRLDANTQKCALVTPTTPLLGGHCVADHQCGSGAKCTTTGKCLCPSGWKAETPFTCTQPSCSSNEFCHANVTAFTVCNKFGHCECQSHFQENSKFFQCLRLPHTLQLGAKCDNSEFCGNNAGCTNGTERICKCRLGYEATSDVICEPVRCAKDEYCHKTISPLTNCQYPGDKVWSVCRCNQGYYENSHTFECSPQAPNIGEACAQKDDKVYRLPCDQSAVCNKDRKCACPDGYKKDENFPFRCLKN